MNRLGDAPTDVLFGLIALNNNLVAPEVIPAASGPGASKRAYAGRFARHSGKPDAGDSATWSRRSPANTSAGMAAMPSGACAL